DVAEFAGRVLGGRLRHTDTANGNAPPTGHYDSWSIRARLVGETAFLAVVDGDVDAARAMLATFDSDPSDVDTPLPLGAARLVATDAIITLMTTDDESAARSAIDRLEPLAATLWGLRWHVELIPVYLALSMAYRSVGEPLVASRRIDDVDVLLAMCEDADLMIRARTLLDTSFAVQDPTAVAVDELTEGERRVVELVGDGLSNRDVAELLEVSPSTVAGHMQTAFRKLGVRSRQGAVMRVRAHRRLRR
ncbi:MAG: hypothetical protein CL424_16425, partial [Acidimicrobiaceae bacterium]|nr:hypothetical protein [Acidimicrobiaceae bacterium]